MLIKNPQIQLLVLHTPQLAGMRYPVPNCSFELWCFFLHEWRVGTQWSIYILSPDLLSTVIIAPLSNLWREGVLVPPNTHRIPSNHPSLICKTAWLFPEAVVESAKSNQGKLLFVSSDQSIYGGIVSLSLMVSVDVKHHVYLLML